jgi:hypothetical protein
MEGRADGDGRSRLERREVGGVEHRARSSASSAATATATALAATTPLPTATAASALAATSAAVSVTATAAAATLSAVTAVCLRGRELEANVDNLVLARGALVLAGGLCLGGGGGEVVLEGLADGGHAGELHVLVHGAGLALAGKASSGGLLSGLLALHHELVKGEGDGFGLGRLGGLLLLHVGGSGVYTVNDALGGGLGVLLGVNSILCGVAGTERASATTRHLSAAVETSIWERQK